MLQNCWHHLPPQIKSHNSYNNDPTIQTIHSQLISTKQELLRDTKKTGKASEWLIGTAKQMMNSWKQTKTKQINEEMLGFTWFHPPPTSLHFLNITSQLILYLIQKYI